MKVPTLETNRARVSRAKGLVSRFTKYWPLLPCFLPAISAEAMLPSTDLPGLGSLDNFAIVGTQLIDRSGTINGNVGIFSGGKLTLGSPAKAPITGSIYLATNAIIRANAFNGTVLNNQDLAATAATVLANSAVLGALTADVTISKLQTASLSYNVPTGEVEVVDLDKGLNLRNANITLTGGGDLVLNIDGRFNLSGSANILGTPDNIFINYEGKNTITTRASSTINGLLFDPNGGANISGTWSGGVFGGKKTITLGPGATLTEAPEPGSMVLISTGLASLLLARRRLCRMKNQFKETQVPKMKVQNN